MRIIRSLKPEQDLESVVTLWCNASIISHSFMPAKFWRDACPLMREVYLPLADTTVMTDNGQIIGFVSTIEHQIAALFVDPDHQGQGVGSALLAHALAGQDIATLDVYAANASAQRFYERHGFRVAGEGIDDVTGAREYFMEYRADV